MSEVFISYSRSDSNFVHQLHSALEKSQREAWVDWENIPTSADWWREICEGIEAADTFIFVISPASVASPVCNLEVGYAIEHNKRFIPVVRAKTNEREAFAVLATHSLDDHLQTILAGREILAIARDNWQAMARHNWLLFTEDADFENTFQKLIEVINTDLEHVRHHTRLLVRAREWENKNKNGAFLLRGEDLKEAEKWLAQSGNKIPNPTKLQTQYIFASRQAANGRQRSLLFSVSAALLISLSLAALSFALFRQSEERSVIAGQNAASATVAQGLAQQEANNRATQQNLAESNAVTAQANLKIALNTQSQFLADLSRQQLDQDQVLPARLLALEGMANYPQVYHQENLNSLINAYYKPGAEVMSFSHPGVGGVYSNHDDTLLLSWGDDKTARVWDRATGKQLLILNHPDRVDSAVWNADESLILTSTIGGAAYIWNAHTGEQVRVLRHTDSVFDAHWNADESQIITEMLVSPKDSTFFAFYIVTWNARTGALEDIHLEPALTARLTSSEHYEVIGAGTGFPEHSPATSIIVQRNGQQVAKVDAPPGGVSKIGFNADETRLMASNLVSTSDGSFVNVWNIAEGDSFALANSFGAPGEIQDVQWNPDGTRLAAGGIDRIHNNGYVRVWNTSTEDTAFSVALPQFVDGIRWLNDGTQLLAWAKDTVYLWDVGALVPIDTHQPYPTLSVTYSRDGQRALIVVGQVGSSDIVFEGYALMWDVSKRRILFTMEIPNEALSHFSFSPDEKYILGWEQRWNSDKGQNNGVHLWDAQNGTRLVDLQSDSGLSFGEVHWFQNGLLARAGAGDFNIGSYVAIYDIQGHELRRFSRDTRIDRYIMTRDEKRLITLAEASKTVTVWDVETGTALFTLAHDDDPLEAAFSPDESRVLTDAGSVTYVWSMRTGELLAKLDHSGIFSGDWSPSGRYILTYQENSNQAFLWDSSTYKTILTLKLPVKEPVDSIYSPAWNADETRLAISARDTLLIWSLPDGKLLGTFPDLGQYQAVFSPDSRALALWWPGFNRDIVLNVETGDRYQFKPLGGITSQRWLDSARLEVLTSYAVRYEYVIDPAQLVKVAQQNAYRPLNNTERQQFFLPTTAPTITPTLLPTLPPEPSSTAPLLLTALIAPQTPTATQSPGN